MQPTRKNYTRRQEINALFQLAVHPLFIETYNGIKCNNALVTRRLLYELLLQCLPNLHKLYLGATGQTSPTDASG